MPSEVDMPPLANTVPSGSRVRFWYDRALVIGAVSRQAGVAWDMSRTAVRAWAAYTSEPLKSGSAQAPAFMILSGRYMTALIPSNGLSAFTFCHAHVPGVIVRVTVSGPASRMRPSESWKRNGYHGEFSFAPVRAVHAFATGS
jgi:hypothetical protein